MVFFVRHELQQTSQLSAHFPSEQSHGELHTVQLRPFPMTNNNSRDRFGTAAAYIIPSPP